MKSIYLRLSALLITLCLVTGCAIGPGTSADSTSGNSSPSSAPSTSTTAPTEPSITAPTEPSTPAPTEPSSTAPTEPPLPETFPMRTVTDADVYIETLGDSQPVATLARDTTVDTIEIGETWSSILMDGEIRYIQSAMLREPGRYLVVIDAGHQRVGNLELEPDGPGSSTMKYKVSYGTAGRFTGQPEYVLNLLVALILEEILLERGYDVVMIRTHHDVDLSNSQRAIMANELYADAFIRIHANGADDPNLCGIMTLCQTAANPYNSHLYADSRALSDAVLTETVAATGGVRQYVWETDTMSGINWCQVPVTIIEMGYMTNEKEDRLMATEEYRQKLALGIANGIDSYFAQLNR